mmetsp:Transcript_17591/g.49748  ORF Transcript_17591/g.49748 Transcript_17591/m.49748 type:complete len:394 (-) Transcript_17591:110-1291(-)|eukprot:CAMPEP_0119563424 /NCGR_PEP_ID=MMETSP1352-20130426/23374_1 /TAXON_ID=265584 /ORGANISM="Stauroneis constricta, Strain CCMP1120" /LENGTH=393 /DNA_ID=CAMNT_0007612017 /DNA_START=350 /DNA_END=1531 /DNA_ORIENTATION=-
MVFNGNSSWLAIAAATVIAINSAAFIQPCHSFITPSSRRHHALGLNHNNPQQQTHLHLFDNQKEQMTNMFTNANSIFSSSSDNAIETTASSGSTPEHNKDNNNEYQQALQRTSVWIATAIAFGISLSTIFPTEPEITNEFFAGYILELSLSVDNLLVFLLLFDYFQIPNQYQNRILNWGIIGSVIMRTIMISIGSYALQQYHSILLVFAMILLYSSYKVLFSNEEEEEEDLSNNTIIQLSKKFIPSTDQFEKDQFFITTMDGIKKATPVFLCMVAVEISDIIFAIDSIPAVFGVTENPIVVFTSNMFAILGLRSLYTILSKAASELKYLEPSVAVVLGFIGSKMIAEFYGYNTPTEVSLGVVLAMLSIGIGASLWENQNDGGDKQTEIENSSR